MATFRANASATYQIATGSTTGFVASVAIPTGTLDGDTIFFLVLLPTAKKGTLVANEGQVQIGSWIDGESDTYNAVSCSLWKVVRSGGNTSYDFTLNKDTNRGGAIQAISYSGDCTINEVLTSFATSASGARSGPAITSPSGHLTLAFFGGSASATGITWNNSFTERADGEYFGHVALGEIAGDGTAKTPNLTPPAATQSMWFVLNIGPPVAGSFPTTPILDNFNRADGGLGTSWTSPAVGSSDATPAILTNVAKAGASVYASAYWDIETFGPDSEVYLTIPAAASAWSTGFIIARANDINTGTQSEYQLQVDASAGLILKRTINDAQSAALLTYTTNLLNAGDKVGMRVTSYGTDNFIEVWIDIGAGWVLAGSYVDVGANTTYPDVATAGYIGFAVYGNNTITRSIDDFGGGTVVTLVLDTALPDADVTTTGWTTTPLFSKVNDASDATVIQATAV